MFFDLFPVLAEELEGLQEAEVLAERPAAVLAEAVAVCVRLCLGLVRPATHL